MFRHMRAHTRAYMRAWIITWTHTTTHEAPLSVLSELLLLLSSRSPVATKMTQLPTATCAVCIQQKKRAENSQWRREEKSESALVFVLVSSYQLVNKHELGTDDREREVSRWSCMCMPWNLEHFEHVTLSSSFPSSFRAYPLSRLPGLCIFVYTFTCSV